jgi:hypothetical protein
MARDVFKYCQQTPFIHRTKFFHDTITPFLPDEVRQIGHSPQTPLTENELRTPLWASASQVLTAWLQVWREETSLVETP